MQSLVTSDPPSIRVLVLGASGMLGNAVFRLFSGSANFETFGTVRSNANIASLPKAKENRIIYISDVMDPDALTNVLMNVRPQVVVNCVGLVKQLAEADNVLTAAPINSLLPHRLAQLSSLIQARLIHMSTDCVFSGDRGMYQESDHPDAKDIYGRTKLLGEVDYPNAITLRTSIIGHELSGGRSLIGWFLGQQGSVRGFSRAVFSGLPTVVIARVIRDLVIPNNEMHGVYHVSADPISKYDLLHLVAKEYDKDIEIIRDSEYSIDRSLDSSRFRELTGFQPKSWPDLVKAMHEFS